MRIGNNNDDPFFSKLNIADDHFVQSKRLLNGLEIASNPRERQSVLRIATMSFDHNVEGVHDEEIRAGAPSILYHCLQRELKHNNKKKKTEAIRICKILSMIYRCSNSLATNSLREIGYPLFKTLLEEGHCCLAFRVAAEDLIHRLSSLDVPLGLLARHKELLAFLVKIIRKNHKKTTTDWLVLHATRILAGLTTHSDSKSIAFDCPELVDTVITTAKETHNVHVRHEAAAVLRNLAWDTKNKTEMVRIQKQTCIGVLTQLCSKYEELEETRLFALEALKHLSVEARNKGRLVSHGNGHVVRVLMQIIRDKSGRLDLRVSAMGTLSNLVTRETSHCIGRQRELLTTLAKIASKEDVESLSLVAAQTIKKLAMHVNVHFRCHVWLFQALEIMTKSKSRGPLLWTGKAYLQQSLLPGCNFFMARCQPVLEILCKLASHKDNQIKTAAMETLSNLAKDAANAKKLASESRILEVLVDGASVEDVDTEDADNTSPEARRHAVNALLSLASHHNTTKRIAKRFGLVASLASYGISQDDDEELKKAAIQGVLLLSPFL